jgi:hypothetical protein
MHSSISQSTKLVVWLQLCVLLSYTLSILLLAVLLTAIARIHYNDQRAVHVPIKNLPSTILHHKSSNWS